MLYQNHAFQTIDFPYKDGILNASDCRAFSNHCHKEMEIMHIRKGSLHLLYNQTSYLLTEGDIIIIPPYINHAFLSPKTPTERLVIILDIDMAEDANNATTVNKVSTAVYKKYFYRLCTNSRYWTPETYAKIKTLIYDMHEEYIHQEKAWEFAIKTFTNLLILTAIRTFPNLEEKYLENDSSVVKLQKAIEYIATNYCGQISLEECAEYCDFNPSYFSKYFKKHMGITFQNYVKNSRIERAKWLLMTSTYPITEIAWQSGFSDIRIFNKIFKQETGENATSFRKHYIQQDQK